MDQTGRDSRGDPRPAGRPPLTAPGLGGLVHDLRAEQAELRRIVEGVDLALPTPAEGWDVRDTVAHLAGTDVEALKAAQQPEQFVSELPAIAADIDGFLTGQCLSRRGLSRDELLSSWQTGFDGLTAAVAVVPTGTKIPWYGPPMSPASFVTARLMEYWAHGQDVAEAAGVSRRPTARLRHICHLGVRTRSFAYANRGLVAPDVPIAVELSGPDGGTWSFGDADATERITGTAEDFCLVVTQRRHRADTSLIAIGGAADEWLDIAQVYAGPPGPGRSRR